MATAPLHVRHFAKSAGADANFALTQAVPGASILFSVGSTRSAILSFVAYTSGGAVSTGTLDLQMVFVNTPAPDKGKTFAPLVTADAVVTGVAIGQQVPVTLTDNAQACVRVASVAGLAGAVAYCEIFLRPINS